MHFTYGRFIPLEYAQAVLEHLIKHNSVFSVTEQTSAQEIFDFFVKSMQILPEKCNNSFSSTDANISYDEIHKAQYKRYAVDNQKLANWSAQDFENVVIYDKVLFFLIQIKDESCSLEILFFCVWIFSKTAVCIVINNGAGICP